MPFPSTRVIPLDWSKRHRRVAAGGMNATCELRAGSTGDPVYDPDTGSSTVTPGVLKWTGSCRVQAMSSTTNSDDQGGQDVTMRGYLVQIDESSTPTPADVAQGWTVKVLTAPNDLALEGRKLFITDVQYGSERFTRDLICDDNLG